MYDIPQQLRHLPTVQNNRLLTAVCMEIRHGQDTTFPVDDKKTVSHFHISVLIINLCMYFKRQCIDDKLLFPLRLDRNRLCRCELHDLSLKIFHFLYIRRIFCSNARVDDFSFLIYQFLHSLHLLYNEPSKVQRQLRAVLEILYAVKLPPLTQREKRYKTLLGLKYSYKNKRIQ